MIRLLLTPTPHMADDVVDRLPHSNSPRSSAFRDPKAGRKRKCVSLPVTLAWGSVDTQTLPTTTYMYSTLRLLPQVRNQNQAYTSLLSRTDIH